MKKIIANTVLLLSIAILALSSTNLAYDIKNQVVNQLTSVKLSNNHSVIQHYDYLDEALFDSVVNHYFDNNVSVYMEGFHEYYSESMEKEMRKKLDLGDDVDISTTNKNILNIGENIRILHLKETTELRYKITNQTIDGSFEYSLYDQNLNKLIEETTKNSSMQSLLRLEPGDYFLVFSYGGENMKITSNFVFDIVED